MKLGLEASAEVRPRSVKLRHLQQSHGRQLWLHLLCGRDSFMRLGEASVQGLVLRSISGDRCSDTDSVALHQGEDR